MRCEIRPTVQDVVRFVWSVLVRRHEVSELDSRLELHVQQVVLVKQQNKSRLLQQLVHAQRLPQEERIPLGPVSKPCTVLTLSHPRDMRRTSRFTLRSSVKVWLNAETGTINKSMFTVPNKYQCHRSLKQKHFCAHRHQSKAAMPLS